MRFFTDIDTQISSIRALLGDAIEVSDLPSVVDQLDDADAILLLERASELGQLAERLRATAAGVVAQRSSREAGHAGLAQSRGHRTGIALVQHVAGVGRAEAARQVRVGEALINGELGGVGIGGPETGGSSGANGVDGTAGIDGAGAPWHASLGRALLTGKITAAQHDAIRQGLGEPPTADVDDCGDTHCRDRDGHDSEYGGSPDQVEALVAAWALAAEDLLSEAGAVTVEELAKAARNVRDLLDPAGAETRYLARHEARSFRMWTDTSGLTHARVVFDDLSAAWVRSMTDAALRPRRGGPRFVDPAEQARAKDLSSDPRTNDQLVFDLVIDVLRAGTLTDVETVFGTSQPGVRLVQIAPDTNSADSTDSVGTTGGVDSTHGAGAGDRFVAPAFTEDGVQVLPGWVAKQQACTVGVIPLTTSTTGDPLNLGRTNRLFSTKQRIALAIRDGGCRWKECDRPASYCEAHHIDEWEAHSGRTDIDRGILLCRFHHMQLHNNAWRITRDVPGDFILHSPDGGTTVLQRQITLRYAWAGTDPSPKRFTLAA